MKRIVAWMLILGLPLVVVAAGCTSRVNPESKKGTAEGTSKPQAKTGSEATHGSAASDAQARAIGAVKAYGGKLGVDESSPDKPVISVDLHNIKFDAVELQRLKTLVDLQSLNLAFVETATGFDFLAPLTKLQTLNLKNTQVTDADLAHLNGMVNLQSLNLALTHVGDAGMEHLKGLGKLQSLNLAFTNVTDAGLERLKGLTNLQTLDVGDSKVTDAGVKKLQQALPKCHISN
jgi:internalin A